MSVRWLAIALAACALGCASASPHMTLAAKMRIDEETRLWDVRAGRAREGDATVRVITSVGFCSGVVIGDALVVTAQHCVTDGATGDPVAPGEVRVELGGDHLPWGRSGVVGVVTCPCWKREAGRDMAVLVLERPLPADVPRYAPRVDAPPREGERVRIIGFGTGSQVWRDPLDDDRENGVYMQSSRTSRDGLATIVLADFFYTDVTAQHGDSGGAVVSLETGELLGVLSEKKEAESDSDDDGSRTLAARLGPCADSIEEARRIEHGAPSAAVAVRRSEPAPAAAHAPPPVVVYGTAWCGACAAARRYLDLRGIPYADRDVEDDPAARDALKSALATAGLADPGSVPIITIGARVLVGFSRAGIDAALRGDGRGATSCER